MLKSGQPEGPSGGSSATKPAVPPLNLTGEAQGRFEKPMSSGMQLQSPTERIKSRFELSDVKHVLLF